MMEAGGQVRLGLIGAGRWGKRIIATLNEIPAAKLVRLASNNPESKGLVGADCQISSDPMEVVSARDIDAVIIASPPASHVELCGRALDNGLAVFVEKPLCLNVDEALLLQRFAMRRTGLVMVDHIHLFNPAFRALKELAKAIGPIRRIIGRAGNMGPYRADTPVLWDWGSHDVAMCLDLIDAMPESIDAVRLASGPIEGGEGENLALRLLFPGEIEADLTIGNFMPKERFFEVRFDTVTLVYDDLSRFRLTIHPPGPAAGHGEPVDIPHEPPLKVALSEFIELVAKDQTTNAHLDLGVKTVEILRRLEEALG
jgi:predicted dehydrogenase